ncbi:hypothetical protein [Streptomyces sp. NPDC101206]|uniref:hypothetical protein n=1 Tax=Streptomyces sp. NPDC101206 TaxID=3366128 RepID=UPI0037FA04D2
MAVAERCAERYRAVAAALAGPVPGPTDRAGPGLAALLAGLLRDAAGAADSAAHRRLLGAAGLPDGPAQVRTLTLALHGAVWPLLAGAPDTLAAAGLDDLDAFARDVLAGVRPGPSGEES